MFCDNTQLHVDILDLDMCMHIRHDIPVPVIGMLISDNANMTFLVIIICQYRGKRVLA